MNRQVSVIALLLTSFMAQADDVYLCKQNGKTIYTADPTAGQCQLLDLKTTEPSAQELERLKQVQQRQAAQRLLEEKQSLEERKIRAAEASARAAERQARAAEAQANYQKALLKAQEEETLKRANTPTVIFVSPTLPQRQVPAVQPSQPIIDIHLGPNAPRDKAKEFVPESLHKSVVPK